VCLYNVRTLDVKAAGGLLCHPVDYARVVALLLNGGKEYLPTGAGSQLIHSDDVKAMLTPSQHKDTGKPILSDGEYYGLGTSLSKDMAGGGVTIRFRHGGAQQGFSAEFYAHRDKNVGIVVLVNGTRDWVKRREVYGGARLSVAVVEAFKAAYGIGAKDEPMKPLCTKDAECAVGQYCDAGIDVWRNKCKVKKADNDTCDLVGGGHQCKSGQCQLGRCYTPNSVAMGGACYVDHACRLGKCSSIDGTRGTCVCQGDLDCAAGTYCNAGVDIRQNKCEAKQADNASCPLVNGARTCKSGLCKSGRCYSPNSVAMGDACYVNEACALGKCSSIDGTRGTCVCDADADCGSGRWCDRGLDTTKNSCKAKLASGAVCGTVGELGVGHRCRSGECKVAGLSTKLKCK
jgi:hypothetical protein